MKQLTGRRAARGFTLIEMVAVVAIVGILAAAAQPMLVLSSRRQQEFALRQSLRVLREALDAHKAAANEHRIALPKDASGYPPTLEVLVDGVADSRSTTGQKIYFLRRMPRNPLADHALPAAQTWGLRSSDSPPEAPRSGRDVFDVYIASDLVGLDGTPYREW